MNFKKIFFLAASVALLAVVVVAAVSFFTPGRELWADTAVFSELGPGAEAAFPGFISVTEDTREVQYVLSYGSSGLDVEFGLRAEDGEEYFVSASGGGGSGVIDGVPAGYYELFVRNASSYPLNVTGSVGIILSGK